MRRTTIPDQAANHDPSGRVRTAGRLRSLAMAAVPARVLGRRWPGPTGPFALRDGDRVVFYGDSITDQRLYTTFVETYVVTRFPGMKVSFVHSGWGGDRVTGGGGGPIDRRLTRDVFAYKPTVVTVMLGMNDASYQPFKQPIFDIYARGYQHLVRVAQVEPAGRADHADRAVAVRRRHAETHVRRRIQPGPDPVRRVRPIAGREGGGDRRRPEYLGRRGPEEGPRDRPDRTRRT